jgi:flagellar basal-body rod protein FlgG
MPSNALQVARTGLDAQDTRMRVIANNLANVSTTAFKRDRANFATLAYQDMRVAGQASSTQTNFATGLNLGTGVGVQSTTRVDAQGTLNSTSTRWIWPFRAMAISRSCCLRGNCPIRARAISACRPKGNW